MLTRNPSLSRKSLRARNNVAHIELLRGDVRPVPQYAATVDYGTRSRRTKKRFFIFQKRARLKTKTIKTTFGKSGFLTQ